MYMHMHNIHYMHAIISLARALSLMFVHYFIEIYSYNCHVFFSTILVRVYVYILDMHIVPKYGSLCH